MNENNSKQEELKNTIDQFINIMVEERNQKNDFFNERLEELEKNMLLLSNEIS